MGYNKDYLVTDHRKHGGTRKKPITVIIPHHNAGVTTGENLAKFMRDTARQLSCTYVIGQKGEVFNTLDESLEPYTTGNRAIDTKAVTFEIANSTAGPNWEVTDEAFNALVNTSIDVFKRHGIKEAVYTGDKTGNIHLHEWYANTNCPGPYLKSKMPELARRINEGLGHDKPAEKPVEKPVGKTIEQMAQEVYAGKHGTGHANRQKSLGVDNATYEKVRARVNELAGVTTVKPTPKPPVKPRKSIVTMAQEVYAGKHGTGHSNRQKSLGIDNATYAKVRDRVNQLAGVKSKPASKTIDQMAREVVNGKHGNGHAQRQKSLGIDAATYAKVRARVNQLI